MLYSNLIASASGGSGSGTPGGAVNSIQYNLDGTNFGGAGTYSSGTQTFNFINISVSGTINGTPATSFVPRTTDFANNTLVVGSGNSTIKGAESAVSCAGQQLKDGADPTDAQDFVTLAYGDANYGAGGAPGGSANSIQINDGSGGFGGNTSLTYDTSTNDVLFNPGSGGKFTVDTLDDVSIITSTDISLSVDASQTISLDGGTVSVNSVPFSDALVSSSAITTGNLIVKDANTRDAREVIGAAGLQYNSTTADFTCIGPSSSFTTNYGTIQMGAANTLQLTSGGAAVIQSSGLVSITGSGLVTIDGGAFPVDIENVEILGSDITPTTGNVLTVKGASTDTASIDNDQLISKAQGDFLYGVGGGSTFPPSVYATNPVADYIVFPSADNNPLTAMGIPFATNSNSTNWVSFNVNNQTYTTAFSGLTQINFGLAINIGPLINAVATGFYISYNLIVNGATVQGNVAGRPSRIYLDPNTLVRSNGFQGVFTDSILYNFTAGDTFRVELYWMSDAGAPTLGVPGITLADIGTDNPIGGGDYSASNWSRAIDIRTYAPDPTL